MTSLLVTLAAAATVALTGTPASAQPAEFCVDSQRMGVDPYDITTPEVCIPFPPPPTP